MKIFANSCFLIVAGIAVLFQGCASQVHEVTPVAVQKQVQNQVIPAYSGLKHRIAIASFDDKTGSSNNLFGQVSNLGGAAADNLAAHLIQTGKVVVLERSVFDSIAHIQSGVVAVEQGSNVNKLKNEAALSGNTSSIVGATAVAYGSVIEFGTKTEWVDAGLSKTKRQIAHAKIEIRLVDPVTSQAFYSEFGEADAVNETSTTLGFGGVATADGTLGDKALSGAVVKLVANILKKLEDRPWQSRVVDTQSGVVIGAGAVSGLKVGDLLDVYEASRPVKNQSTGATLYIPGKKIGQIRVDQTFGANAVDEGSVCSVVSGGPFTVNQEVKKP